MGHMDTTSLLAYNKNSIHEISTIINLCTFQWHIQEVILSHQSILVLTHQVLTNITIPTTEVVKLNSIELWVSLERLLSLMPPMQVLLAQLPQPKGSIVPTGATQQVDTQMEQPFEVLWVKMSLNEHVVSTSESLVS